jgi:DNA-binding NtrC family response regulator
MVLPQVILVVDDEPFVLSAVSSMLSRAGFEVLRAATPAQALSAAAGQHDAIHLIVCDVVMPGLSGPKLAVQLHAAHPEASFLFMAGLPDSPEISELVSRGIAFLPKPFGAQELLAKVREVLAAPAVPEHPAIR